MTIGLMYLLFELIIKPLFRSATRLDPATFSHDDNPQTIINLVKKEYGLGISTSIIIENQSTVWNLNYKEIFNKAGTVWRYPIPSNIFALNNDEQLNFGTLLHVRNALSISGSSGVIYYELQSRDTRLFQHKFILLVLWHNPLRGPNAVFIYLMPSSKYGLQSTLRQFWNETVQKSKLNNSHAQAENQYIRVNAAIGSSTSPICKVKIYDKSNAI